MTDYYFSRQSKDNLAEVLPRLRVFCDVLLQCHDFKVVCGLRTLEEQRQLVDEGRSKTMDSKHLKQPSGYAEAVDLWPIVEGRFLDPSNTADLQQWAYFGGLASMLGEDWDIFEESFDIRWGGDWDRNHNILDTDFKDFFHFEVVRHD